MARDFNADLDGPKKTMRDKDIAEALVDVRLEDRLTHFLPRSKAWDWDGSTRNMACLSQEVRSDMECLLFTDLCLFRNVSVRDPQKN